MKIRRERKHQYGNSNIRRVCLKSAVPDKTINKRICLASLKKNESVRSLNKTTKSKLSEKMLHKMTQKNMKSIIGSLKKSTLGKREKKIREKNQEWQKEFADSTISNQHHYSLYFRSKYAQKEPKKEPNPTTLKRTQKKQEYIDVDKINKFRECVREKYKCKASANRIFKEWDGERKGKVGKKDIGRISRHLGYHLNEKECELLLAFEDHEDKGHLLPFELLKFVFGENGRKVEGENGNCNEMGEIQANAEEVRRTGEAVYNRMRRDVLEETKKLREEEKEKEVEGVVRKNRNFILREINRTNREEEKALSYNRLIRENYLKIIENFEENAGDVGNIQKRGIVKSERIVPKKGKKTIRVERLAEILEKAEGSLGRKAQMKEFSRKFACEGNANLIDMQRLLSFLESPRERNTKKRSKSFNAQIISKNPTNKRLGKGGTKTRRHAHFGLEFLLQIAPKGILTRHEIASEEESILRRISGEI